MSLAGLLESRAPKIEPAPRVVSPLPPELRRGLIALMSCSLLSVITTFCVLIFLTWRFVFWRRYYSRYPGYNQCVILIYNLLLADLQQSSSFLVTPYWLQTNQLSAYSGACFAQAWLINFGDVASGLFVLAIGAHTFAVVVGRRMLGYKTFVGCVVGLWIFCVVITVIAPASHGKYVFVPAGGWCWIDRQYEPERLYLHYLWIFISEFGSVALYATLFVILRKRVADMSRGFKSSSPSSNPRRVRTDNSAQRFNKVIGYMLLYPVAYLILSLPIAAGRMSLMSGRNPGETYFYASGCIIMCSGWVDSIIYFTTRRRLVEADITTSGGERSTGADTARNLYANGTLNGYDAGVVGGGRHARATRKSKGNESTDRIIESVEFADLNTVHQTTVIEVTSEPARLGSAESTASESPGAKGRTRFEDV